MVENAETSSRVAMLCRRASVGNATSPQALEANLVSGAHRLVSGSHAAVTPRKLGASGGSTGNSAGAAGCVRRSLPPPWPTCPGTVTRLAQILDANFYGRSVSGY